METCEWGGRVGRCLAAVLAAGAVHTARGDAVDLPLPRDLCAPIRVRVAVAAGRKSIPLSFAKGCRAVTPRTGVELYRVTRPISADLSALRHGVSFGEAVFRIYGVRFYPEEGTFQIGTDVYSGHLDAIRAKDQTLTLIEELDVEDYLKGVLPKELPALWPGEILKAQAVLSRTFALFQFLSRTGGDYHLMVEGWAQRYGGKSSEHNNANDAIEATRGQVLTYDGRLVLPFFHANSGGQTTGPETIWDMKAHPGLRGVDSAWSLKERNAGWSLRLSSEDITVALLEAGHRVGPVSALQVTARDKTGRVTSLLVRHLDGELAIKANPFRMAMGADRLRSTLFSMEQDQTGLRFDGKGWGHGVGLCQWGGRRMAEEGRDYRAILAHYFPGCALTAVRQP